jgi:hypothetical protein
VSTSLSSLRLQGSFAPANSTSVVVNDGYRARSWTINNTTRYPTDCKCTTPGQLVDPGLLSGQSEAIPLVAPGQVLIDRLNQWDIGFRRSFTSKERLKIEPEVQFFNLLNSNAVITQSTTVPASAATSYSIAPCLPGGVGGSISSNTPPRLMRVTLQVHW